MLTKKTTKVKVPTTPQTPQQLITNHYSQKPSNQKKPTERFTQQQLIAIRHAEKIRNKKHPMEWLALHLLLIKTLFVCPTLFNKAKWIGLVVLGIVISLVGFGQVYNGSYMVTSQTQIDTFNYSEITDSLIFHGADFANVVGLTELESVGGNSTFDKKDAIITLMVSVIF